MKNMITDLGDWLKALILVLIYALVSIGMISLARASEPSISQGSFLTGELKYAGRVLRTGTYLEQGKMKGCVLYLEGLGDSILNHEFLFRSLGQAGYRTVTFDYFGQGGSTGDMSSERLTSFVKSSEIRVQAKAMWKHFSEEADPVRGLTCAGQKRLVIGWSTGGLAAYQLAHERWAQGVVLLAPGIVPKASVGLAAGQPAMMFQKGHCVITKETLTRARFAPGYDPHVELPNPCSPGQVKAFAINLFATSQVACRWTIDPSVKGLVLLSGFEDTYVNSAATRQVLASNTHFAVHSYVGALHELDNEIGDVRTDLVARTIGFLNSVP